MLLSHVIVCLYKSHVCISEHCVSLDEYKCLKRLGILSTQQINSIEFGKLVQLYIFRKSGFCLVKYLICAVFSFIYLTTNEYYYNLMNARVALCGETTNNFYCKTFFLECLCIKDNLLMC